MMKDKIRSSRISFMGNYFLGISLLVLIFIANLVLAIPEIITYFLLMIAIMLFFEPEGIILYKRYELGLEHISEIKGVFIKKQLNIPYRAIADHRLNKGIIGRILDYGDLVITGPKTQIRMRGIRKPETLLKEIEDKLSNLTGANPTLLT